MQRTDYERGERNEHPGLCRARMCIRTLGVGVEPSARLRGAALCLNCASSARLTKFIIHDTLGRVLRKFSSQKGAISSTRLSTALDHLTNHKSKTQKDQASISK